MSVHGPPRNRKAGTSVRMYLLHAQSCYLDRENPKKAGINLQICMKRDSRKDGGGNGRLTSKDLILVRQFRLQVHTLSKLQHAFPKK